MTPTQNSEAEEALRESERCAYIAMVLESVNEPTATEFRAQEKRALDRYSLLVERLGPELPKSDWHKSSYRRRGMADV
jgi:uncharacterized protein involved in exopolysaccharide biosynthesis